MTGVRIEVTKGAIRSRSPGNRRPVSNYYECVGPDGRRFSNSSIVELRRVLKARYGGDVEVVVT
jgi:hypothetical protein